MQRFLIPMSVIALFVILALPAPAQTPSPKRAQVQADLANLLNQEVELKDQGKKIDARDRDETEKNAAIAKDIAAYDAEQTRLTEEDRRYVSTVTSHNAACGGTYTDTAHVEKCNNRKRELDALQSTIVGRDAALSERHRELDTRSKELQKEMDETARRKRENKTSLDTVAKAIAAKREVVRLLDDSVVSDLRKREQIGRNCADLPTVEQVKACAARPLSQ
jgi:chromosome segregation ATPase